MLHRQLACKSVDKTQPLYLSSRAKSELSRKPELQMIHDTMSTWGQNREANAKNLQRAPSLFNTVTGHNRWPKRTGMPPSTIDFTSSCTNHKRACCGNVSFRDAFYHLPFHPHTATKLVWDTILPAEWKHNSLFTYSLM